MKRFVCGVLLVLASICVSCGGGRVTEVAVCDSLPNAPRRIELLFTGDVMQHLPQINAARTADGYDYAPSFEAVRPLLQQADVAVVNLETTLSERPPYTGYPLFRAPAELARELARCGVDAVCLANNHTLDYGARGVRQTMAALDSCGMRHTGVFADSADYRANRIVRFEKNGIRVALLNYTYGTNGMPLPKGMIVHRMDTVQMALDLQEAVAESDCVVAVMHWGIEYERKPNREQRRLAEFLHRNGADIIIGHHPHTIQPYEVDSARVCFYSLGNFVSNQRKRYCDGGLMARVHINKESNGIVHYAAEAIPVWVDKAQGYRIEPLSLSDSVTYQGAREQFRRDTYELLLGCP